jgi:hypothetical protein
MSPWSPSSEGTPKGLEGRASSGSAQGALAVGVRGEEQGGVRALSTEEAACTDGEMGHDLEAPAVASCL